MAFNHAKEEKKFKERKTKEEKLLRSLKVDESLIDILYDFDRDQFNCDRRFGENEDVTKDIFFICKPSYDKKVINSFNDIIEELQDEDIYISLVHIDVNLKRIIYLLIQGYTIKDISKYLGISTEAIYKKIQRLRKKFKKMSKY